MKINSLNSGTAIVSHLTKNDIKFFEKNPFGNVSTGRNDKGIKIILSLGTNKYSVIKGDIISLTLPKKSLISLAEGDEISFGIPKNHFGLSRVSVYLNMN